jgi:hypothetical protein
MAHPDFLFQKKTDQQHGFYEVLFVGFFVGTIVPAGVRYLQIFPPFTVYVAVDVS